MKASQFFISTLKEALSQVPVAQLETERCAILTMWQQVLGCVWCNHWPN